MAVNAFKTMSLFRNKYTEEQKDLSKGIQTVQKTTPAPGST
ncbi:MAG: hypothetical protein ACI8ZB_000527 [Desulforhopalus sp.]|jgi:hypothetical protein